MGLVGNLKACPERFAASDPLWRKRYQLGAYLLRSDDRRWPALACA
jgi:hypothetical protein